MAHFTCDHGKQYYPFGKGGRENLLRGCRALIGSTSDRTNLCGTTAHHFHPPGEICADIHGVSPEADCSELDAVETSAAYLRLRHCPLHSLPIAQYDITAKDEDALLPVTLKDSASPISAIYQNLATDVLNEVFKTQISAQLVSLTGFNDYNSFISIF